MLANKNILLGVCGSIASYKSAVLIRLLIKAGAKVRVVMTKVATDFISPLTLSTLSKNPVLLDHLPKDAHHPGVDHVSLALWADCFLIVPATAHTLAKMANGTCDNLLTATYLSAKCTVYFAPAMDREMWQHPATRANIEKLLNYKHHMIAPNYGELASGLLGEGRMEEPEAILSFISTQEAKKCPLVHQKVLVTAGPTQEHIDPVRFISSCSSGKMGYALAHCLSDLGADVTLISGPSAQQVKRPSIKTIMVTTAAEMQQACEQHFVDVRVCIMAAAVADYRPVSVCKHKIKKTKDRLSIELCKNPDILTILGQRKSKHQILVGFSLETDHQETYALEKLKRKNLDFIVLNSSNDKGSGFQKDSNKITIIDKYLQKTFFELKSKEEVAKDIAYKIITLLES